MRLDHVVIRAYDAQATLSFYGGLLGLPLIEAHEGEDWGGFPWLMMVFGLDDGRELVLVVLRGATPPDESALPADSRHYALAVETPAEYATWRERVAGAGLAFWEETHGERASLYFPDPAGVILEITTPPTDAVATTSEAAVDLVRRWMLVGLDQYGWVEPLRRIFGDYVGDRGLEWGASFMATVSAADPAFGPKARATLTAAREAARLGDERVVGCMPVSVEAFTLYDAQDRIEELTELFEKACAAQTA